MSEPTGFANFLLAASPSNLMERLSQDPLATPPVSLSEYLIMLATTADLQLQHRDACMAGSSRLYHFLLDQGLSQADAQILADAQNKQTGTNLLRLRLITQTGFVLLGDQNNTVNQIVGRANINGDGEFRNFLYPEEATVLKVEIDIETGQRKSLDPEFNAHISGAIKDNA